MSHNDNHLFADPRLTPEEFAHLESRAARKREQAQSPVGSLPDLGIQLTATEEADLRAYAEGLDVDFEKVVQYYSDAFHVLPPRRLGPISSALASKGFIPVNKLAYLMKVHIYELHWEQKQDSQGR